MKANSLNSALRTEDTPPVSPRTGPAFRALLSRLQQQVSRSAADTHQNTDSARRPPSQRAFSLTRGLALVEVRLRFRMRTFLLAMTAAALVVGLMAAQVRRLEMTVAELEGRGGIVVYDASRPAPNEPFSLRRTLAPKIGDAWFARPTAVIFPPAMHVSDEDLRLVSRLGSIETIHLDGYQGHFGPSLGAKARDSVTDRGLAYLERLPHLRQLTLRGVAVTPDAVADFRESRPECLIVDDPDERLTFFKL